MSNGLNGLSKNINDDSAVSHRDHPIFSATEQPDLQSQRSESQNFDTISPETGSVIQEVYLYI